MSMIAATVNVTAPARTPHKYGLFSVLDFLAERPLNLSWDSIGCGLVGTNEDPCLTGINDLVPTPTVGCADGSSILFTVTAYDDSSMGRAPRTADSDRAERSLFLGEQVAVETRLTQSVFDVANPNVTAVAGSNIELQARVSLGEAEIAVNELGGEGVLLVRRALVSLIPEAFVTTGSMLRTKLGTPVAACAGWGATVPVNTVLGAAALIASRNEVSSSLGYFRDINSLSKIAQRDYAIGWDCQPQRASTTV